MDADSGKVQAVCIPLLELEEFADEAVGWKFSFPFYARAKGMTESFSQDERPHLKWSVLMDDEYHLVHIRAGCKFIEVNGSKIFPDKKGS